MWIYLNIFNISAYCTVSKIGTLANGLQIKNRVSIINCGSDSYIKKLHIWKACIPLKESGVRIPLFPLKSLKIKRFHIIIIYPTK